MQLLAKGFVNGPKADPIWAVAKAAFPGDVEWNFSGVFLFDKNGICVGRYDAEKLDELGEAIDRLLACKAVAACAASSWTSRSSSRADPRMRPSW